MCGSDTDTILVSVTKFRTILQYATAYKLKVIFVVKLIWFFFFFLIHTQWSHTFQSSVCSENRIDSLVVMNTKATKCWLWVPFPCDVIDTCGTVWYDSVQNIVSSLFGSEETMQYLFLHRKCSGCILKI